MIVREAIVSDGLELARLRWEFSPEQAQAGRATRAVFELEFCAWVRRALAEGRWKIWVAESEARLVGNLFVELVDKVPRPGEFGKRYAYMTNVFVAEAVRGAGVGGRLVDTAIAWAKSESLEFVVVWPSEESVSFYRRHGFRPSESMEHRLS